jgi:hypothetical protein
MAGVALSSCAMIKGTTNRASWLALVLLALGCGGRAENQDTASTGGSEAAGGAPSVDVAGSSGSVSTPGVGPIDASGLPTELPIACPGLTSPPQLALPCKVGMSLTRAEGPGSINVLECYDLAGNAAFSTTIPFGNLPTMLNQPVQIPFASLPQEPSTGSNLSGTVVFSRVDPVGRAFVARLIGGAMPWMGVTCTIPDTPFWGVQGGFI